MPSSPRASWRAVVKHSGHPKAGKARTPISPRPVSRVTQSALGGPSWWTNRRRWVSGSRNLKVGGYGRQVPREGSWRRRSFHIVRFPLGWGLATRCRWSCGQVVSTKHAPLKGLVMGENRPYESDGGPGYLPREGGVILTETALELPVNTTIGTTRLYPARGYRGSPRTYRYLGTDAAFGRRGRDRIATGTLSVLTGLGRRPIFRDTGGDPNAIARSANPSPCNLHPRLFLSR
jgi:hypothetical protein